MALWLVISDELIPLCVKWRLWPWLDRLPWSISKVWLWPSPAQCLHGGPRCMLASFSLQAGGHCLFVLQTLIKGWFGRPFSEPCLVRWATSNCLEIQSPLDSNSFRFWIYIVFSLFYSQCITKMTNCLPQNVSGILFLSNTPPTGNKRQNIIPFGH